MSLLRNVLTYMGLGPDEDYDDGYRHDAGATRLSDDIRVEPGERSPTDPHAPRERPRSLEPQRVTKPPARSERPARPAPTNRPESNRPEPAGGARARTTDPAPSAVRAGTISMDLESGAGPGGKTGPRDGAGPGGAAAAGDDTKVVGSGGPRRADLRSKSAQTRPLRAVPPAELGIQTDLVQPENGLTVRAVTAEAEMVSDSAAAGPAPMVRRQVTPRLLAPGSFGDAKTLADDFMSSVPVVMNLRGVERDLARRLIDFASGICYALEGTMEKMAPQVFLLSPRSVEVSQEDRRRMEQRNYEG